MQTRWYCRHRWWVEPDDFDREDIRHHIHAKKINITLKKLLVT